MHYLLRTWLGWTVVLAFAFALFVMSLRVPGAEIGAWGPFVFLSSIWCYRGYLRWKGRQLRGDYRQGHK